MARIRSIKPGFFTNDSLGEMAPLGRLLFAGLWTLADREGRLEERPKKIKAELLPYDDCDVVSLLDDLAKAGFIVSYSVKNKQYLQIVNFARHQCPNSKEAVSTIPPPPELSPVKPAEPDVSDVHDKSTVQEQCEHKESTPLLGRERKGKERKGEAGEQGVPARHLPPPLTPQAEILQAICTVTATDLGTVGDFTRRDLGTLAGKLARDGETAESVGAFASWYARENLNGKNGGLPSLKVMQDRWGAFRQARAQVCQQPGPCGVCNGAGGRRVDGQAVTCAICGGMGVQRVAT